MVLHISTFFCAYCMHIPVFLAHRSHSATNDTSKSDGKGCSRSVQTSLNVKIIECHKISAAHKTLDNSIEDVFLIPCGELLILSGSLLSSEFDRI